jgi:hypothetical protein
MTKSERALLRRLLLQVSANLGGDSRPAGRTLSAR